MVLRRRQGPGRCCEEEQRQWDPQEGREAWWPEGTGASRQGQEQENREPRVLASWTYSAHLDTPSEPMSRGEAAIQDVDVRLPQRYPPAAQTLLRVLAGAQGGGGLLSSRDRRRKRLGEAGRLGLGRNLKTRPPVLASL